MPVATPTAASAPTLPPSETQSIGLGRMRGVAVLVDLGGAETNSEMAIEMLPEILAKSRCRLQRPVVEGAVMAATESSGGSPLEAVKRTAEELMAS